MPGWPMEQAPDTGGAPALYPRACGVNALDGWLAPIAGVPHTQPFSGSTACAQGAWGIVITQFQPCCHVAGVLPGIRYANWRSETGRQELGARIAACCRGDAPGAAHV